LFVLFLNFIYFFLAGIGSLFIFRCVTCFIPALKAGHLYVRNNIEQLESGVLNRESKIRTDTYLRFTIVDLRP